MVYQPNKAIHPGHVISRTLEREGMSQKNLSERTGLTEKHLSQIINGNASITVETALLLENALGGSASFWINLEKNYQETTARLERSSFVRNETKLLSTFPYLELVQRGYVEQTSNREKRVENLWKFYGVNSLLAVRDIEPVAFRKRANSKIKSEAINARFPFLGLSDSIYLNHSLKLPVPIFSSIARFSSVLENNELFAFLLV